MKSLNLFLVIAFFGHALLAQNRQLVWSDEFNGTDIDRSAWKFDSGPSNDNVQYYTDRPGNAQIADGKLQLSALRESYQGFEYTSALIKTERALSWKYGRVEALIKLPGTSGFVPAFWLLPEDDMYGWWPRSGEIDIMEHPTNEVTKIYGTVHTESYNLFSGPYPPQGSVTDVPDAESAFHLYAVEWTTERIDFYVDDQKFYSFSNDNGDSKTWPFDRPFYVILNLAVGGGWVGNPDESSQFPAVMEVDYVRVYQDLPDVAIQGTDFVEYLGKGTTYTSGVVDGAGYQWSVPAGATIVSGQNTPQIIVDWGIFGGDVESVLTSGEGTFPAKYPVRVSPDYLGNPGFEKGVKYWRRSTASSATADFRLTSESVHHGAHSLLVEVTQPGANSWDVQLSQGDLSLQGGQSYHAGFWARSVGAPAAVSAAIINAADYSLVAIESINLTENWTLYGFDFIPASPITAAFNIDMGDHSGSYYFDDFVLTTPELTGLNLVRNPDFFDGQEEWDLNLLSGASATGAIEDGLYAVSITEGGSNYWDVHLGQSGLLIELGKEYMVSFDAYAYAPGQISALVGKNAEPWTLYSGTQLISLTSERQTFGYTFAMNEPTDALSRLGFDVGGEVNQVYIDNVMLRERGPQDPAFVRSSSFSPALLQVYPNPVVEEAAFYYFLHDPAEVSLRIFNLNGQEMETLVHGMQQAGGHRVMWHPAGIPAGIYFCQFRNGRVMETRKLILQGGSL